MKAFQILLLLLLATIFIYTALAISNQGYDLISPFFGDIQSMTWPGQFNVDFTSYLILSALWLAWREGFSVKGIFLALLASVLGIMFFAPYLLFNTIKNKGDMKVLLLGHRR